MWKGFELTEDGDHKQAKKYYKEVYGAAIHVNDSGVYSLTFNITKNCANQHRQKSYLDSNKDVRNFYNELGPYIRNCFIATELNKSGQIHFHTYFQLIDPKFNLDKLIDLIKLIISDKRSLWKDHGYGWKLKFVDDARTPEFQNYPFKDITRTVIQCRSYSATPFIPLFYYKSYSNILIDKVKKMAKIKRMTKHIIYDDCQPNEDNGTRKYKCLNCKVHYNIKCNCI